ncbi:hypothetical protein [Streptomyces sp. MB09-02B]|uniref:hypothetical protein n=1 Tax=Streptomyces sp. MB09-02B TaxID=3028667 RepID=UPI0029BD0CDC|nr:hypothetical protein [Streptomyces sp. MB09-02B]MDX3641427.1 hypothetical protein [Streptomyces sp. MB09-02B]
MPEYASPTEAKQGELLRDVLEIQDVERDTHPNQLYTLRTRLLNLDTEETQYVIDAINRAKRIAVKKALNTGGGS